MAIGSNLSAAHQHLILERIHTKMGIKPPGRGGKGGNHPTADGTLASRQIILLTKDGVPATNTANDAPTGLGDLCYDYTNNDVYRCTAYTSGTVFTWTKIVD